MSEERLTLAADPRTVTGKKVKNLRQDDIIPCVVYGKQEAVNIQIERNLLRRVLRQASTTQLVDIDLGGQTRTVLTREIQQHVTRGDLLHVDFYEVDMQTTIRTEASLVLVGAAGEDIEGLGDVVLSIQSVEIECLPGDLISEIEVDVSVIQSPDDSISVRDLPVPSGVTILTDSDRGVAQFQYIQTEEALEAEEAEEVSVEDVEVIEAVEEEEEE